MSVGTPDLHLDCGKSSANTLSVETIGSVKSIKTCYNAESYPS